MLGGGDFDVIQMATVWTAQFAAAGWVEDVTGRLPLSITHDIPASSLRTVTYRGKVYGVPLFSSAKHLFYHRRILKEAGFDRPPTTLNELIIQAKATTGPGQWGSIWSWKQSEALVCDWLSILFTKAGAQFADADGKAIFHPKRKEAAWQLLQHMAGPSWQKASAITTGNYPILATLYTDPELQRTMQDFSVYGEQFNYLVVRPQMINYAQISDIIQKPLHAALLRETDPQDAMDAAAADRATVTP